MSIHSGLLLREVAVLNNPVEQLATRAQLQHQVDVASKAHSHPFSQRRAAMILKGLVELANVGVVQDLHDLNLLKGKSYAAARISSFLKASGP